jgi:hypothetical protein
LGDALEEITPDRYKCSIGVCPAAFRLEDGKILLIGKKVDLTILNQISDRIGDDEYAIVVDAGMLENVHPE